MVNEEKNLYLRALELAVKVYEADPSSFPTNEDEVKEKVLETAEAFITFLLKGSKHKDISSKLHSLSEENIIKVLEFISSIPTEIDGLFE